MTRTRHSSADRLVAAIRKSGECPAVAKTVGRINWLTSLEATPSGPPAGTRLRGRGVAGTLVIPLVEARRSAGLR